MYQIAVLPGDGIGAEVTKAALEVLQAVSRLYDFSCESSFAPIGGAAIDEKGTPLPEETVALCRRSDAVLLGAVGGPQWDHLPGDMRPEQGILGIRAALGLFANLRPAIVYAPLRGASPLKDELLEDGLDLLVVRELTGGIYFGKRGREFRDGMAFAYDTELYSAAEIERIAHVAFGLARKRGRRVCSVDKANVLESSRLWRETVIRVGEQYPDIALTHLYVDNASMQLVRDPRQFDVIVTNNIFGDILSDEASQITGSIGMLPSASLGAGSLGLYEPVHGSAPDIAGQNKANPIAAILSVAMMLRYSLEEPAAANAIEAAVERVLQSGARTADLGGGGASLGTVEMGRRVAAALNGVAP